MHKSLLISLLVTIPLSGFSAVYKFYDEDGNLVFSDQPGPNAEEVELQPISEIKTRKVPSLKQTPQTSAQGFQYDVFEISSPEHDTSIRSNSGTINVDLKLEPALNNKLGHKISLLLDGNAVSKPVENTAFTLNNVDRGSHNLSATIVDKNGNTIASTGTVTVHLLRHSKLFKNAAPVAPTPQSAPAPITPPKPASVTR